ncbi:MAG: PEP-CTERM-box response regulator transcription factor [bacterium]|nr:MAG: PEP-CTERM-box response regulator transcription factor [bacterium]
MPKETLLIVDDEEAILKQIGWAFKKDFSIVTAGTVGDALDAVKSSKPDLMLLDLSLTGDPQQLEGFQILETALSVNPLLKVIVMTGHDERENALRAIEKGAFDFYTKPISTDELRVILSRAAYLRSLEQEIRKLREHPGKHYEFENIIAMSASMQEIFRTVKRVAPTDVSVLITGESGTGKELIARAIHRRSSRSSCPFVPINCGAIPENLLESELFGHEKGSFTGAHAARAGKFETADGGTIFLDEIGELTPNLQVKILRFLQDQVIERVGGREPIQVNVRIIAATNRDLNQMLEEHQFREDLFYRINTININLPPLRERDEDILLLAMHFLHHYNTELSRNIRGFSKPAQQILENYEWPGNIRELENRIKRAVIMAPGRMIQPEDMDLSESEVTERDSAGSASQTETPDHLRGVSVQMTLKEARDTLERRLITSTLLRLGGNISATAQELAVSRPTLHDLIKKHGINPEDFRSRKEKH